MFRLIQGFTHILEAFGPGGHFLWKKEIHNLVPTEGHNFILDTLHAQSLYVGLKGSGTPALTDTMASHPSWSEIIGYSQATRPELIMAAASAGKVTNSANKATYSINATVNISGVFVSTDSTKSGVVGNLLSVSDFDGIAALTSGSTLYVTVEHESTV